ncbi:MAG: VOC family protein [Desulfobacteraceae bacterium]|nr:VOC family protein [Desulfobacteraceae bacterium]
MSESTIAFHHNHMISEDPKTAASWYADKLGGRIIGGPEALEAPSIVVTFKGIVLIIRGRNTGEKIKAKQGLEWGMDHFGFQVEGDFDAYCKGLKEKGVIFTLDPVDINPNLRIAFIEAPDNTSIELLQNKR